MKKNVAKQWQEQNRELAEAGTLGNARLFIARLSTSIPPAYEPRRGRPRTEVAASPI